MSKKKLLVMILALGTILAFGAVAMAAKDIYVDADMGEDALGSGTQVSPYKTLTHAILTKAANGDTVYVDDGMYDSASNGEVFPITLPDFDLTITFLDFDVGGDPDGADATIDATGADYGFKVVADNVYTIDGKTHFILKGAAKADIHLSAATDANTTFIKNCAFQGDKYGIEVEAGKVTIQSNTFASSISDAGVWITAGHTVNITSANAVGADVSALTPPKAKNRGNVFSGIGSTGIQGGVVVEGDVTDTLTITNNEFENNLYGVYLHDDLTGGCADATINYNEFDGNTTGIHNADTGGGLDNIDVDCNWWGDATGPSGDGYIGSGDVLSKVSGADDWNTDPVTKWLGHELWTVHLQRVDPTGVNPTQDRYYHLIGTVNGALNDDLDKTATRVDTIYVDPGTYKLCETFPLDLDKAGVTLKSTNGAASTTIHDASGASYIIDIKAANVTVGGHGFTIKGDGVTGGQRGIYIRKNGFNIKNNELSNILNDNILVEGMTGGITSGIIDNNTLVGEGASATNCRSGILLETFGQAISGVTISNNTLSHFGTKTTALPDSTAISVAEVDGAVSNITITGNTVTDSCTGVCLWITHGSAAMDTIDVITGNTFSGCKTGITILGQAPANVTINNNDIFGNTDYGVNNGTTAQVDAASNYWGHYTGPQDPEYPSGQGDKTSDCGLGVAYDYVHVTPALNAPYDPAATTATYSYAQGAGYYPMSVPLTPGNPAPAAVYDELAPVTVYGAWPFSSYQDNPDIDPNRGTWVYLAGNTDITEEGTALTADQDLTFPSVGWYLFSAPYTANWKEVTFTPAANFYNDAGDVALWAYNFSTGGYTEHYSDADFVINPWLSYWVKVETVPASLTLTKTGLPPHPTSLLVVPMSIHPKAMISPPPPPALGSGSISVELAMSSSGVGFVASGPVTSLRAKVFALDGGLVAEQTADGNELVWSMQSAAGEPVANGVYLVNVSAMNQAGYWIDLGLFRVLVLR